MDPANLVIISAPAAEAIVNASTENETTITDSNGNETGSALSAQTAGTYVFESAENYEAFDAEIHAKGLAEQYRLSSSDISGYEASLVPLKNLSSFAATLLLIVLAIGAVILVVLNVFNIRERKYEVGVLTAIGIKKGKVALQFVTELLGVALIAIIVGAGVGAAVSVPVSNSLLASQIEQIQSRQGNQNQAFGRDRQAGGGQMFSPATGGGQQNLMSVFGSQNVSYMDTINATVNMFVLGQMVLIGIVLTIIASFAAIIFVLRYEPLKILANRS
jgi:putative ABC transport system permease protein